MGLLTRIQTTGFLNRLTSPERATTGGTTGGFPFFRVPRIPGIPPLTHYTSLSVAAHFACVSVISKNLAQCPWEVVEEKPNGDWEYRRTHPAYYIFNKQPNPEMTAQLFKEQMLIVALLWGASYSEIDWDFAGRPRYMWPLEPERCILERNEALEKGVRVTNFGRPDTFLTWENVYSITGPGIGFFPFDMVVLASRTLAQALAQDQFGLKFYEHGTALGGVLSTDASVDQAKLDALREKIEKRVAGVENAFRFLVLSQLKYQPINQTLRDAQSIDFKYQIIEEICRFYGVPPHKIAHLLRSTNNNIEHQGLEYTRDCLTRWARFAEQEAVKIFGNPRYCLKIDMDELAEGDAKSVAETDSILVNAGLRTRNELRQKRGWNSYGEIGDVKTVQGAMTTLEAIVEAPAPRQNGGSNPQPQPDPAQEDPQQPRRAAAARAIYTNAIKRAIKQQHLRAKAAATKARGSMVAFRERMREEDAELRSYLATQLDEAMHIVHDIGMNGNSDAVRRQVRAQFDEHTEMIFNAFTDGDVDSWCKDVDRRAEEIAASLLEAK